MSVPRTYQKYEWVRVVEKCECPEDRCHFKPIYPGEWGVAIRFYDDVKPSAHWCSETGKRLALSAITVVESEYLILLETMPMEVFEKLSKSDKITAIAKRFKTDRSQVEALTEQSMIETWRKGVVWEVGPQQEIPKPQDPLTGNLADALAQALKGKVEPAEGHVRAIAEKVVTERTPGIIKLTRDSVAGDLKELKELLNSKREVVVKIENLDTKEMGHQHFKFEEVFKLVAMKLNLWLAGPAGAGKTFLASEIARALERPFFRISCGPQTPASQIFGHTTAMGGYAPGIAYQALTHEKGAVLLFDEFDRMNPAVAVMVNGLLDGGAVTFPNGETLKPSENTTYLVAANTFGKPTAEFGTAQRQDTATMSRFVKILIPVDEKLETNLFGPINKEWVKFVQKTRGVVERLGITSLVVTPRASEYGVRMLANGITRPVVEDLLLWNGVNPEDIKKIKANLNN